MTETGEGPEPYTQGAGYSDVPASPSSSLGGGSKRRKRGKRNSRKSKKYMKKRYRGGADINGNETGTSDITTEGGSDEVAVESMGGRRKSKKMRNGKMKKSKARKGKVSNWITHVKNFAKSNKIDFRDALKDPKCKSSYHKMK